MMRCRIRRRRFCRPAFSRASRFVFGTGAADANDRIVLQLDDRSALLAMPTGERLTVPSAVLRFNRGPDLP